MEFEFSGEVWYWKGPAPFFFVTLPEAECQELKRILRTISYGWGMVPVMVRIGTSEFKTALWPKDGRWILPLKSRVRKAESIEMGDIVTAHLEVLQSA